MTLKLMREDAILVVPIMQILTVNVLKLPTTSVAAQGRCLVNTIKAET